MRQQPEHAWPVPAADFPSLALEEEPQEDDFDARRRALLQARFLSQAPVVFSQEVDDPRLRWKGNVRPLFCLTAFLPCRIECACSARVLLRLGCDTQHSGSNATLPIVGCGCTVSTVIQCPGSWDLMLSCSECHLSGS